MKVRRAEPRDIVLGRQLVCEGDDGLFVATVEEVLRPSDPWKAFVSDDGCRYGLDGAWVLYDLGVPAHSEEWGAALRHHLERGT